MDRRLESDPRRARACRGGSNIEHGGPFLFVSNHASYLDVLALYHDFPLMPRFWPKKPHLGAHLRHRFFTLDHVYIDRRPGKTQTRQPARPGRQNDQGKSVFIFPGGKRAPDGRIGEWKKGAFVMAIELGLPVVPVGICGSAALHGIGDLAVRPGAIDIRIGRPIATAGLTYENRDELLKKTRSAVEALLDRDTDE